MVESFATDFRVNSTENSGRDALSVRMVAIVMRIGAQVTVITVLTLSLISV